MRRKPVQLELKPKTWGGKRTAAGGPKTVGVVQRVKRPRRDKIHAQIQRAFFGGQLFKDGSAKG